MRVTETIANDLPSPVAPVPRYECPQVWYGPAMEKRGAEWTQEWTAEELSEIEAAIERVERRGLEILDIGRDDFPLEEAAEKLDRVRREVLDGRGFVLLRGLPIKRWSLKQAATAFWGLGTHLGEACSQNGKGHVLGHVKNLGLDYSDPSVRGYQTGARLPYHTDSSDIVGLLCLRGGKAGGLSSIVSSTTLYNEVARRRPDLVQVLMQPFHRTRWGEIPEGKQAWAQVPVFMPHEGRMIVHYVRSAIRKGQSIEGVPELTDRQVEALDLLDSLAADPRDSSEYGLPAGRYSATLQPQYDA